MNYYQMVSAGNVGCLNLTDKCVVVLGEGDSETVCDREAKHVYDGIVKKDDGTEVRSIMHVCDRHQIIFEEFMNEQGEYQ